MMRNGIRLGRLFGIQITLDVSWIVIFLLVSWNLTMVFGTWHHAWPFALRIGLAVVAALLFFASVLAHELAHSLVARAFGIGVKEIRLFLFGGVSNIAQEPPSAKAELAITIVGPLTSIVFGVTMSLFASIFVPTVAMPVRWTEVLSGMGPIGTLLMWLGSINVLVGVFNLIPGFPLDGGRLLRAFLWWATDDLRRATLWASAVGQAVGWGLAALGVAMFFGVYVPLLGGGFVSGLWLVFIGWFLASAAHATYRSVFLRDALEGVLVSQLMRRSGPVIPPGTTLAEAVNRWFMHSPEHAFPVVEADGTLIGLLSPSDIRRVPDDRWDTTLVSSVMTPADRLTVVAPADEAATALTQLATRDVNQLPVVRPGTWEIIGMLERSDVARWLELRAGAPLRHRPT
jgi:Zn-dependent protease/CBS domain-containing protein